MKIALKLVFVLMLFFVVLHSPAKASVASGTCTQEQADYYASICAQEYEIACGQTASQCAGNCASEFPPDEDPEGSQLEFCQSQCTTVYQDCMEGIGSCVQGYCGGS
jgi:hypothetical protein